jgi:hypothetical protein
LDVQPVGALFDSVFVATSRRDAKRPPTRMVVAGRFVL